ncbi:MAG: hypothetical protein OHK0021_13570 [Bryobacter sp.]
MDATEGANYWIFRPPTESRSKIGFAVKLPTGRYNLTGEAIGRDGQPIVATADQSNQTGDGRTGFVINVNA